MKSGELLELLLARLGGRRAGFRDRNGPFYGEIFPGQIQRTTGDFYIKSFQFTPAGVKVRSKPEFLGYNSVFGRFRFIRQVQQRDDDLVRCHLRFALDDVLDLGALGIP